MLDLQLLGLAGGPRASWPSRARIAHFARARPRVAGAQAPQGIAAAAPSPALSDVGHRALQNRLSMDAAMPLDRATLPEGPETDDERVLTTFRWPAALDGREVAVLGSFTDWEAPVELRRSPETGDFVRTIALAPGTYQVCISTCNLYKEPYQAVTLPSSCPCLLNRASMAA